MSNESADNPPPRPLEPTLVTSLRVEIIESQKAGTEFLKWKLIATATVSSILVGVGTDKKGNDPQLQFLIVLIPLVCAYVDLISLDLAIRILAIAAFLRSKGDVYEFWVHDIRENPGRKPVKNPFAFAPIAVHGSSAAIGFIIFVIGLYGSQNGWDRSRVVAYLSAGGGGALVAIVLWRFYKSRADVLAKLSP